MSKKITFSIDLDKLNPFYYLRKFSLEFENHQVKPLVCPICGKPPRFRGSKDIRCYDCSITVRGKPQAPAIYHNGHINAGIRAWNTWVNQFDINNEDTWVGEVCLNFFKWYDMGYADESMLNDTDCYVRDFDFRWGYRKDYDLKRECINTPTGPHCKKNEKITRIFGSDSLKYLNVGLIKKLLEMMGC